MWNSLEEAINDPKYDDEVDEAMESAEENEITPSKGEIYYTNKTS